MNDETYQPNRWKIEDENGDIIDYYTDEDEALDQYAKLDLEGELVSLYSCYEDAEGEADEWDFEESNFDNEDFDIEDLDGGAGQGFEKYIGYSGL